MNERARSFLQFNIGHLLTLIALIGSAVGIYTQRERDLAGLRFTSESHANSIRAHADKLYEMDRAGTTASRARLDAEHALVIALTARFEAQGTAINKVDVMANDIAWIKSELQRRARE
jgi:hypothetical protein